MDYYESDRLLEQWLQENDEMIISLPNLESEPHLLISKVRKHYLEHLVKLLSVNYENNQRLQNKNIYLPSAIWRCAKSIEMSAAKSSMVTKLYRQNVCTVIKDLKDKTKKGKLYKKLYDCLHYPPLNEKKTQTMISKNCNCQCTCDIKTKSKVPESLPNITYSKSFELYDKRDPMAIKTNMEQNTETSISQKCVSPAKLPTVPDIEIQNPDDLMQQLEKLFEGENDDDIFENALFDLDSKINEEKIVINEPVTETSNTKNQISSKDLDLQKPLDERLALLSGILVSNTEQNDNTKVCNRSHTSKWLCEEYFLKAKLFELLDEFRDTNRHKLKKVRNKMLNLFGNDSDDEGVVSPIEETPDFVNSCKERISPWVVKILTPYYVKGRIIGKALFKALAKHLINLIYQCSKYPYEYEVQSFVKDFLDSHTIIRCEADFQQFRIENI